MIVTVNETPFEGRPNPMVKNVLIIVAVALIAAASIWLVLALLGGGSNPINPGGGG